MLGFGCGGSRRAVIEQLSTLIQKYGLGLATQAFDDIEAGQRVRSILGEFGMSDDRFKAVAGRATGEPFFPNDPYMAANERVRITVVHTPPPVPAGLEF